MSESCARRPTTRIVSPASDVNGQSPKRGISGPGHAEATTERAHGCDGQRPGWCSVPRSARHRAFRATRSRPARACEHGGVPATRMVHRVVSPRRVTRAARRSTDATSTPPGGEPPDDRGSCWSTVVPRTRTGGTTSRHCSRPIAASSRSTSPVTATAVGVTATRPRPGLMRSSRWLTTPGSRDRRSSSPTAWVAGSRSPQPPSTATVSRGSSSSTHPSVVQHPRKKLTPRAPHSDRCASIPRSTTASHTSAPFPTSRPRCPTSSTTSPGPLCARSTGDGHGSSTRESSIDRYPPATSCVGSRAGSRCSVRSSVSSPPTSARTCTNSSDAVAPVIEVPLAHHHVMLDQPLPLVTGLRTLLADWDHSVPQRRG